MDETKTASGTGDPAAQQTAEDRTSASNTTADSRQPGDDSADGVRLPEVTFSTFVLSLASSALVQLGEVPDPATGTLRPDAQLAKHAIDTLAMLEEKTRKGLNRNETELLQSLLYELRMKYVVLSDREKDAKEADRARVR